MSRKAAKNNGRLMKFDELQAEDFLTNACGAEEIAEYLRALGGEPEAMDERARTLGAEIARRASLLRSAQAGPAALRNASERGLPQGVSESDGKLSEHLQASPFGPVTVAPRNERSSEEFMKRDFEFRQLLRAYRSGIISDQTFESEMKNLEGGATNGSTDAGFRAFGTTYASEREAVIKFLEAVAPAETAGGEAVGEWLKTCKLDCIKGGLKMVVERESYHGRAFAQRLMELGGTVPQNVSPQIRESIDYLCDTGMSDLAKLQKAVMRYPNPEETIRPLFEFADLIKEDQQTKEMVKLFAQDELSTLKWQHSLCTVLTEMQKNGQLDAAA
jgi:hypothetical protein